MLWMPTGHPGLPHGHKLRPTDWQCCLSPGHALSSTPVSSTSVSSTSVSSTPVSSKLPWVLLQPHCAASAVAGSILPVVVASIVLRKLLFVSSVVRKCYPGAASHVAAR